MDIIKRRMLEGHSIGIDEHYVKPSESDLLEEYQKAIDALTINPENRLKRELKATQDKQDEISLMRLKHEKEMEQMNDRLDKIYSLVQENPKLAKVKKEVLTDL